MADEKATIGWREWVQLPDLDGAIVKAKVDTGARTSSLHAFDVTEVERDGETWIEFGFHPLQRDNDTVARGVARLIDRRNFTASSGHSELRYVVETHLELNDESFPIELSLTDRDALGFRMLLGRRAIRDRCVVDAGRSYLGAESKRQRKIACRLRRTASSA